MLRARPLWRSLKAFREFFSEDDHFRMTNGFESQTTTSFPILSSTSSRFDPATFTSEIMDILSSAAELANSRLSKITSVRAEQHANLKLREFHVIFEECWAFVIACEILCKRMIVGFRGALVAQVS